MPLLAQCCGSVHHRLDRSHGNADLPLPHEMQLECPEEGWYLPRSQEEQELEDPEDPLYFPLPQEMQPVCPEEG